MFARFEVRAKSGELGDALAESQLGSLRLARHDIFKKIVATRFHEVTWCEGPYNQDLIAAAKEVLHDPVLQDWIENEDFNPRALYLEKRFRPGVTDNVGQTLSEAFSIVTGVDRAKTRFASGGLWVLNLSEDLSSRETDSIINDSFSNPLIESVKVLNQEDFLSRFRSEFVSKHWPREISTSAESLVASFDFSKCSDAELVSLSAKNLWALNLEEMKAIQAYFISLGRPATDVEIEVLAQTWSEHCKHKIFNAEIEYSETTPSGAVIPARVQSLFKEAIAGVTKQIPRPWLLSVFSDNAGLVAFDDKYAVCIKVETHNSPSALDPYGGALTGIVGVNRDIMGCGLGAKPIFNTNVFCVASASKFEKSGRKLPEGLLHPFRILEGIRKGVEHGGNKSGIPTVNGALVFDERYLGKPLVYCGTGGLIPRMINGRDCAEKKIEPGDKICMIGGRIGKDGIHGATFSSLAMEESTPASVVQLGDPMTQKRVLDFLMEARDLDLYRTLTDNGAGGLSSSIGELSQLSGGARMDVGLAKTKYPGLKPYELTVSESQERMSLAVPPEKLAKFEELARRRSVEVSVLGEFTNSGRFEILFHGKQVGALQLDFLHGGAPKMKLKGEWKKGKQTLPTATVANAQSQLLELLSDPNIASKEWLIRQYDHEVQASSVIKPLQTIKHGTPEEISGPNDAGVLKPLAHSNRGLIVGCGLNPKISDIDSYLMAALSVDEAVRNVLCVGAEYGNKNDVFCLVDNFCWPDPVGHPEKTAALVRACFGMREACLALELPLVSGKDSMKNDYRGPTEKISIPPTLLMTAMAQMSDIRKARSAEIKNAGDSIWILGPVSKTPNWTLAKKLYTWLGHKSDLLRSAHDVSEGGWLVALAEVLWPRSLGLQMTFAQNPFDDAFHSFIVSAESKNAQALEAEWSKLELPFIKLGESDASGKITNKNLNLDVSVSDCHKAWKRDPQWGAAHG